VFLESLDPPTWTSPGDLGGPAEIGELTVDRVDDCDQRIGSHYRFASIVQDSPDPPIFSKPARWYSIRERLWTATESDNAWNPSSRAWTMHERRSA